MTLSSRCPSLFYDYIPGKAGRLLQFIAIRLRFDTTKNEHVHFFVASRGVVANKKAVDGAYNDVIVYVSIIRMAFTLTDQRRVASFD